MSSQLTGVAGKRRMVATGHSKRRKDSALAYQNVSNVRGKSIAARTASLRMGYFKSHMGGFPQKFSETLRFAGVNATQGLGATTFLMVQEMNLNNTFDNGFGGNHPAGWTKLMAVYTKCFVKSASVEFTICNVPATVITANVTDASVIAGITITTLSTSLTGLTQAISTGLETHGMLGTQSETVKKFRLTCDMRKFLSVDDLLDNATLYGSTTGAGPTQGVFAQCWAYNNAGVTTNIQCMVVVSYDCVFTDPLVVL